jgi:hypothetical protein
MKDTANLRIIFGDSNCEDNIQDSKIVSLIFEKYLVQTKFLIQNQTINVCIVSVKVLSIGYPKNCLIAIDIVAINQKDGAFPQR